jgi:hypothetical protein
MQQLSVAAQRYKACIEAPEHQTTEAARMLATFLAKPETMGSTRMSYLSRTKAHTNTPTGFGAKLKTDLSSVREVLDVVKASQAQQERGVCIIENISPVYVSELGAAWDITSDFFAQHVAGPPHQELWTHIAWQKSPDWRHHLYGIYECGGSASERAVATMRNRNYCDRVVQVDSRWPVSISTVVSFCVGRVCSNEVCKTRTTSL